MKKILFLFSLFYIGLFAQSEPAISSALIFTDGRGSERVVRFGVDPIATDGIDIVFGESLLPPFPPAGVLEVQLFLPTGNFNGIEASYWDFRQGSIPMTGDREHRIKFQKGLGDSVFISWFLPQSIQATLLDMVNGTFVNKQLTGSGTYLLPNPEVFNLLKLTVHYSNTSDVEELNHTPGSFELSQNFPNPFNPSTSIRFSIAEAEYVTLKVFDVLGKEIETLVAEELPAGSYQTNFNSTSLTSGIYFYTLKAGEFTQTRSMVLVK